MQEEISIMPPSLDMGVREEIVSLQAQLRMEGEVVDKNIAKLVEIEKRQALLEERLLREQLQVYKHMHYKYLFVSKLDCVDASDQDMHNFAPMEDHISSVATHHKEKTLSNIAYAACNSCAQILPSCGAKSAAQPVYSTTAEATQSAADQGLIGSSCLSLLSSLPL